MLQQEDRPSGWAGGQQQGEEEGVEMHRPKAGLGEEEGAAEHRPTAGQQGVEEEVGERLQDHPNV